MQLRRLSAARLALALALAIGCGPSQNTGAGGGDATPDLQPGRYDPDADHDGDHFTPRQGDCDDYDVFTHPGATEICGDHKDQNCNGVADELCDDDKDGWAIWSGGALPGGDCNDGDPLINPGALEVPGNGRDDNCDGVIDEPVPSCDVGLAGADALALSRSMELCAPWLKDAALNKSAEPNARRITRHFGTHNLPQASETMTFFSTGIAADRFDSGYVDPQPGTAFQRWEDNPLPITSNDVCTDTRLGAPKIANDLTALTLTIQVPTNVKAFQFRFNFFSAEYPENIGNQYNDMFVAYLQSKRFTGNISFDENGNPITVNGAFFEVCDAAPICGMVQDPKVQGHRCDKGPGGLDGTGYEIFDAMTGERYGGATGWLTTTAPVMPGEVITLTLFIFDSGDWLWDSAVLLDGFQWLFDASVMDPVTQ